MRKLGCPETSVKNYHYMLRNTPEERSSQVTINLIKITLNSITTYIESCTWKRLRLLKRSLQIGALPITDEQIWTHLVERDLTRGNRNARRKIWEEVKQNSSWTTLVATAGPRGEKSGTIGLCCHTASKDN
jgi:hypothetical protein